MSYDAQTRARLVGIFVAEAEETIAALREHAPRLAREEGSAAEFGRIAHGLKGAAASLGYEGLARALHGLEDLALAVRGAGAGDGRARLDAVSLAVDLLGEGIARMAASGADAPPSDVVDMLLESLGAGGEAEADAETEAPAEDASPPKRAARRPSGGGEAGAAEGGGARTQEVADRMSVPAADVDAALRLASSAARAASQLHEALQREGGSLAGAAQSLAATASGLEAIVASLRLLPAEIALDGLEEEIGGLAASLGKEVAVEVRGRDVRADRRTLQTARGMIRHLVRNALDHGVEAAAERARAGKPRSGRLTLALAAGESALRVEVADDGAGFDLPAIRAALEARSGDGERIASLSDDEVLQAWALDGGSTRATATQVSGRGLGLSAVARLARAAGGGLRVRSVRGEGSAVEFTLPLEVYAIEALTVAAAGRTFAIPLAAVERTVHVAAAGDAIHDGPTGRTLAVGETILPLGALAEALGVPRRGAERFAVVVRSDAALAAFAVEEIGAVEGMVPASVPGVAEAEALVTGLARLGDGGAVAVLNPRLLVARARATRTAPHAAAPEAPRPEAARPRPARAIEVVLAEDSLATREVLRVLLEEQGFRVRVAADGEEALERVRERAPDVLVSDVNMPRRDGLSLTRALRALGATERLPIVLLTSQDDDATRAAGAAAGADAYLVKSRFNAQVLEETLSRIGLRAR